MMANSNHIGEVDTEDALTKGSKKIKPQDADGATISVVTVVQNQLPAVNLPRQTRHDGTGE
jgi:hypothetical protein